MASFTGSTSVGWDIAASAPRKKVALELGSCAPVVVAADASVREAAAAITAGAFSFAGQSCISTQRVIVHESIADELVDELPEQASSLVVGDPSAESTEVGPLITEASAMRVERWIEMAREEGATVACGGRRAGSLVEPAVVTGVAPDSELWCREVFGPVVAVRTFRAIDDALDLANGTDLALQAGVFTADLALALALARGLDFGGVVLNGVPTFRTDQQPYGGRRDGGNTVEGPAYAVREMTREKLVVLRAPSR